MSRRELEPFLHDVLKAGQRIIDYAGRKTEDEYVADELAQDVAERNFITIGEALRRSSPSAVCSSASFLHNRPPIGTWLSANESY